MKVLMIIALGLTTQTTSVRRAKPPAEFPKYMTSIFMDDAFKSLEGEPPLIFSPEDEKVETAQKEEVQGNGDFDREDMMRKLETAEEAINASLSNKKTFNASTHKINGGADIVIMMGKTLFNNDPDYGTEDNYLKFAEDMTTAAKQLKILTQKGDYEGASRASSIIKKNCNACHDKFRL
jgi:cytochrome c556